MDGDRTTSPTTAPTLSWFSPLPPDATGVAEFATHVLPSIALLGPVRVWRAPRHRRSSFQVPQGSCEAFVGQSHLPRADVPVYNIGNSIFHIAAARIALARPGIVILHDTTLDALARYIVPLPDRNVSAVPRGPTDDTSDDLLHTLVDRSRAIVVHSNKAAARLDFATCPVVPLALPYRVSNELVGPHSPTVHRNGRVSSQRPGDTTRTRSHDERLSLVIFGHLGPNRRIDSVVQAIAAMPERDTFVLDIFGWGVPSATLSLIRATGLQGIVRVHGAVSDQRLDTAIANADLGFNLRFPTMGESSFSQLRYWAHSVPTACTRSDVISAADQFTWYIRADNELEDIRRVLLELLADRQRFRTAGELARRHLAAQHAPDTYARALWTLAKDIGPIHNATC